MKLKKFNKSNRLNQLKSKTRKEYNVKNRTLILSIGILLLSVVYFTYARYESNSSEFTIVNATVGDFSRDVSIVGIYQGETKVDNIPARNSGYVFKEADCSNGATASFDSSTNSFIVNTTGKTKCTLYFVLPTQTAVEYITSKSSTDSSIVSDGTTDNNLRYVGANPNNYVLFNNELWRIIGVMNNIQTSSGQTQSLLKIIRADSMVDYSWDSSTNSINSDWGINQWGPSNGYEGADLMRELNTDYLGNTYVGLDGKWYNRDNNSKTADMPSTIINKVAQTMIENVVWNLGSPNNNNGTYDSNWENSTSGVRVSTSYTRERASTNGKVCSSGSYCNDSVTRTSSWTGKVGLFYPSDYLYATSGGSTTNRTTCLNTPMSVWNNVSDCYSNDWLFDSNKQWTMSPAVYSSFAIGVFFVNLDGSVTWWPAYNALGVHPVVFLKSSISIIAGEGTSSNPYSLG